jgi:hypothetical protein
LIKVKRLSPAVIAVCGAGAVAGCGGTSDKDKINAIIKAEGANPPSLCDHLTDALLTRLGGKAGCRKVGSQQPKDPSTHATSIKVSGSKAAAVVVDRQGKRSLMFEKQGGDWKVAS